MLAALLGDGAIVIALGATKAATKRVRVRLDTRLKENLPQKLSRCSVSSQCLASCHPSQPWRGLRFWRTGVGGPENRRLRSARNEYGLTHTIFGSDCSRCHRGVLSRALNIAPHHRDAFWSHLLKMENALLNLINVLIVSAIGFSITMMAV